MKDDILWQNFKLGQELEIACNFIYDALKNFDQTDHIDDEHSIFPVLYGVSIGIERILKVAIVLIEYDGALDINEFEKSLITHNHSLLFLRIRKKYNSLNFSGVHTEFLELLSKFYKAHRYDRFSLQSFTRQSKEVELLKGFLEKCLNIKFEDSPLFGIQNTKQIKNFIGKITQKIIRELYSIIKTKAREKNIYTYELSESGSKAGRLLFGDQYHKFDNDHGAAIEILIYLLSVPEGENDQVDLMRSMEPIAFDPALIAENYLPALFHATPPKIQDVIDEAESLYEDIENKKERLEMIELIKDQGWFMSSHDEENLNES